MLSVVNVFKRRTNTRIIPKGLKYFHLLLLQTNMKKCKEKHENTKRKIHNDASPRRTVDNIMTEQTYDNVKHMFNSYEDERKR